MTAPSPGGVQRWGHYECAKGLHPMVDGDWVGYGDHVEVAKERELYLGKIAYCAGLFIEYGLDDAAPIEAHARSMVKIAKARTAERDEARAENARLRKALEEIHALAMENTVEWCEGVAERALRGAAGEVGGG